MKLSLMGARLLAEREGVRTKAYQDTKGIWTIGIGHTGPEVRKGLIVSIEKVYSWFESDVKWAEDCVNNNVTITLTQNQFDALVSFVFNIGATAFVKSTILRKLNKNDIAGAVLEFDRWVIPKEITGRRMSEKKQFQWS